LTEPSSALLGAVGEVPGCAVLLVVLLFWFHWPELEVEPDVLEPEVVLAALDGEELASGVAALEPVAELLLMPLEPVVSVVLQAARPKHRAAAKRALVMVMMSSFKVLISDSSLKS
jgi:hypothetical protein